MNIRGFTLIETLVAVAIFGLIGVVASQMLVRVNAAKALGEARAERLANVQRSLLLFERDVVQAVDRPIRDAFGDPQPALRLLRARELELTRGGWSNPLDLPRSSLQRVAWNLDEAGRLQRRFWTVLDRAQDSAPVAQTVLEDVSGLSITLIDADGRSWEAWPADDVPAGPASLPGDETPAASVVALRLQFDAPPFGRIERLLPMPMAMPALAAPDARTEEEAGDVEPDGAPPEGAEPEGAIDAQP